MLIGYPSGSAATLLGEELPFGTVLVDLLVGFPLGVFVLVVMLRVLLLNLLVLVRFRVVLGCLVVGEFLGALKQFGYTGKPQRRFMVEDPRFRHNGSKVPHLHQSDEAHGPQDRVGVG